MYEVSESVKITVNTPTSHECLRYSSFMTRMSAAASSRADANPSASRDGRVTVAALLAVTRSVTSLPWVSSHLVIIASSLGGSQGPAGVGVGVAVTTTSGGGVSVG